MLHRSLALIVGVQLLFWVLGGLTMASLDLERVRGADRRVAALTSVLDWGTILPPQHVLDDAGILDMVHSLRLDWRLGQPVYLVQGSEQRWLIGAQNAELWSPLSQQRAVAVALADYSQPTTVAGVEWVDELGTEYRGRELPLWKVQLADARRTALYVDPYTAEVVARRNNYWRVFDWMWMLHIMDYRERSNFNHPLLLFFAATTLGFVLSGAALLLMHWRCRQG